MRGSGSSGWGWMTAVLGAQLAFGAWSMTPWLGVRHSFDADIYLGTGFWAVTCFVPLVSAAALLLKLLLDRPLRRWNTASYAFFCALAAVGQLLSGGALHRRGWPPGGTVVGLLSAATFLLGPFALSRALLLALPRPDSVGLAAEVPAGTPPVVEPGAPSAAAEAAGRTLLALQIAAGLVALLTWPPSYSFGAEGANLGVLAIYLALRHALTLVSVGALLLSGWLLVRRSPLAGAGRLERSLYCLTCGMAAGAQLVLGLSWWEHPWASFFTAAAFAVGPFLGRPRAARPGRLWPNLVAALRDVLPPAAPVVAASGGESARSGADGAKGARNRAPEAKAEAAFEVKPPRRVVEADMADVVIGPAGFKEVRLAGAGATSRVYRAIDASSGAVVALKRLHRQLLQGRDSVARLRRELEALGRLRHPGIVPVRGVVSWHGRARESAGAGGDPTIVMDFVPGEDLKERLVREGRLSSAETERIGRALLDILATAHGAGIVHRDIKPQNIRIRDDGQIVLLDFGSARLDAASRLTVTGTTVGTPEYMAPELFAGAVYDPRVDIYGVGATLFECLTGRTLQAANSLAELAFQRTTADAPRIAALVADVPPHLAQVIDRCLARAPEDRYPSAALATWALDHPAEERAFRARRSSHPPCLHCLAPIPPESGRCPSCRSDHPFAYGPGDSHVELEGVSDPRRLIEHVVALLPERATVPFIRAAAERIAALSYSRQRYLSFIRRREAEGVVEALAASGVRARAIGASGSRFFFQLIGPIVLMFVLLAFAGHSNAVVTAVVAAFVAAPLLGGCVAQVLAARAGMLAASRYPPPLLSGARLWLTSLAIVEALLAAAPEFSRAVRLEAAAGLCAALIALVASWRLSFAAPGGARPASVEPGVGAQLARALGLGATDWTAAAPRPTSRARPVSDIAVILCIGLVAVETSAVLFTHEMVQADRREAARAQSPGEHTIARPPLGFERGFAPAPLAGGCRAYAVGARTDPVTLALEAIPFLSSSLILVVIVRRRRRVHRDAAAIIRDLDLAEIDRLGARSIPLARRSGAAPRTGGDVFAALPACAPVDPFGRSAFQRAVDLACCLPDEAVDRLGEAVQALGCAARDGAAGERSLVARCILETDPEQRLRFEFLALEGQLEAAAAEAWAARLAANSPGERRPEATG